METENKHSTQLSFGFEANQVQATNDLFASTNTVASVQSTQPTFIKPTEASKNASQVTESSISSLNSKNEMSELGFQLGDMGLSSRASSLASTHKASDHQVSDVNLEQKHIKVSADSISYNQNSPCPFGCSNCGASFETIQELKRHLLRGHCVRNRFFGGGVMSAFSAHSVESSRSNKGSARYAQSVNDNRQQCTVCEKTFQNKWLLKRHMKIHSGEKNYACNVCGKKFREKSDLKTHSVKHTNIQRYQCNQCGKKFKWNASYRYHKFQSKSCGKHNQH